MIGVKKAAINKYETDVVSDLKRSVILSLSKALRCSPLWIMGLDVPMQPIEPQKNSTPQEVQRLIDYCKRLSPQQAEHLLQTIRLLLGDTDKQ